MFSKISRQSGWQRQRKRKNKNNQKEIFLKEKKKKERKILQILKKRLRIISQAPREEAEKEKRMATDVIIASWRYKMKGKTGLPYQLVFVPTTQETS